MKKLFLFSIFFIGFSLINPHMVHADAICDTGWFCGIPSYDIVVNINAKTCFLNGSTWQCSNLGTWACNGTWKCDKAELYYTEGGCWSATQPNCRVNINSNGGGESYYNDCSISGGECTPIHTTYETGCCIRETVTPTPTPAPTKVDGVCSNPDIHYTCAAGTSANNVSGETTWTWDCNGSGGGTSASCSENRKSCSVSISGSSVSFSGSNAPQGNNIRLWLARQDKAVIVPAPANQYVYTETGPPLGSYTSYLVADCTADATGSCSETYSVPDSLPAGDYYFHCDIQNDPDKCSGQPFCNYENPPMPGGKDCTGYRSCSLSDNLAYTHLLCTLGAVPATISVGEKSTISITVAPTGATISKVDFSETGSHTTPASITDNSSPFFYIATGASSAES
jgi:hypothetical protein